MRLPIRLMLCLLALWLALPPSAHAADSFQPYWVQNHRATQIWSGVGEEAISFGVVPAWSYFQVVQPQQRHRLYVLDPRTGNYAYINALDVGPSGPPAPAASAPPPEAQPKSVAPADAPPNAPAAPSFRTWWVVNHSPTPLWSAAGEEAINLGEAYPWNFFEVLEPQRGTRLRVRDPRTGGEAYLEAGAVGPADAPSGLDVPSQWWGTVGSREINVRAEPNTKAAVLGELPPGTPVLVRRWVEGEAVAADDPTWAELADGTYVWASLLRKAPLEAPPPPAQTLNARKWIDVNLTHQTVTAYEGDTPIYWALTASGRPGWETPTGLFSIQRRVEKEIMDSNTLLGRDAGRADYRVENVRWTQYFTAAGNALHENYWKLPDTFGIPSSHGCLGLLAADAKWFWDWATIGTPVYIHY